MNVNALRHEKEEAYLYLAYGISGLLWLTLIWFAWAILIPVMLFSWITGLYLKAQLFGNAVKVSRSQFPEIQQIVDDAAGKLGLTSVPDVFIANGQGVLNALAIRVLSGRYMILYGDLVDLSLDRKAWGELTMIISHELAHHRLGHISIWRTLFLWPATTVPFLGGAYARACELSADRVAMVLTGDTDAACNALVSLSLGSRVLAGQTNLRSFIDQEQSVPSMFGLLQELYSTHPRMTKRILELKKYAQYQGLPTGPA
ncbi:M48 family metallopeptidase [Heliophilum fasciatum]|uniref:Zn-dependent protease with chaperone function n=1 Tax=Heliophilum fasciatum TaxID=35700 RepID=A0A4R2RNJ1_9FIRM|nr:M48 family metallopeptidase [Heliophilum fasciatum]MCW2277862.1 Zn-dependent protease with chaperone function [Heliophilum fasciatum]TCP64568.1 Zn-dependent protease with chaperone function [Heliophilum fasciatum]